MKKTIIKTVAVTTAVFALSTASVFARSSGRDSRFSDRGRFDSEKTERALPPAMMGAGHHSQAADVLGTVSEVSKDKATFTVKDADGKEAVIHVSAFTRIHALPTAEERAKMREDKKTKSKDDIAFLSIEDIKKGDFVAVSKLGGETKTIEAGRITIAK